MKSFEYKIIDSVGIHARPAGLLVKKASEFKAEIELQLGEKKADAKKIFSVMGLAAKHGDTITIKVDGEDEETVVAELEKFFKENL